MAEILVRIIDTFKYNLGPVVTLIHATLAEVIENSDYIIDTFRNNTGMHYKGIYKTDKSLK